MPSRSAALRKEIHQAQSAAPAVVYNVCDSGFQLGLNQSFTWSNTSNQDCTISPSPTSVWPFTSPSYYVPAGKMAAAQTYGSPPLAQKQQTYIYQVTGGGCSMATTPKNVLIP
jgi:hypothetical protein